MMIDTLGALNALPKITDYSALREGDILFFSGTDAISDVIKDATDSIWSHVGLLTFDARLGGWEVLQAYQPQVIPVPLPWFLSNASNSGAPYEGSIAVGRWNGITPEKAATAVRFGLTQVGKGYGTLTIGDIALHILARRLPPITPNGKNWICSELVQQEYFAAGLSIPTDANGFCSPGDCGDPKEVEAIGSLLLAA